MGAEEKPELHEVTARGFENCVNMNSDLKFGIRKAAVGATWCRYPVPQKTFAALPCQAQCVWMPWDALEASKTVPPQSRDRGLIWG